MIITKKSLSLEELGDIKVVLPKTKRGRRYWKVGLQPLRLHDLIIDKIGSLWYAAETPAKLACAIVGNYNMDIAMSFEMPINANSKNYPFKFYLGITYSNDLDDVLRFYIGIKTRENVPFVCKEIYKSLKGSHGTRLKFDIGRALHLYSTERNKMLQLIAIMKAAPISIRTVDSKLLEMTRQGCLRYIQLGYVERQWKWPKYQAWNDNTYWNLAMVVGYTIAKQAKLMQMRKLAAVTRILLVDLQRMTKRCITTGD